MRPSKRILILDAALRVIERDGVTAVTYETVAEEAGITKAGVVYHFPTREALLHAARERLATHWENAMTSAAGGPAETLSEAQRLAAYATVTAQAATRAELELALHHNTTEPATSAPFIDVMNRWTPPLPHTPPLTTDQIRALIARLAADGLWLHETLTGTLMPDQMRRYLAQHIADLVPQTPNTRPAKHHGTSATPKPTALDVAVTPQAGGERREL
ncbi:TetR family transcriptional regulator [Micromonospora sp. ATCC 39149]|uniref:TetR/AcrR family transcriptional regulator n=1 Tax=Micromonospora carbonacea TaxID=47853 RepID=A0A7D6CFE7_9ACTN|nr:TetR/AcrR family transcriptional regulator [Micromonospora sp. ATCC 39149]EEP69778.1 TetR family transcriptional regulator [Micromonospora sp. ATCC 39149]QLJ96251.1 TetR/AcrR family transcriptional regulator [Micromonospora carbonacea]